MDFNSKRNRLIFAGLFLISVILITFMLYAIFFRPAPGTPTDLDRIVAEPGLLPYTEPSRPREPFAPLEGQPTLPTPLTKIIPESAVSEIAKGGYTKVTPVKKTLTSGLALAQNGKNLIYLDKASGQFWQMNEQGEATLLSSQSFHDVDTVAWSPDNKKAIMEYPDGANILYDFQEDKQITLPKHWSNFSFSPGSSQIVFKSLGLDRDDHWLLTARPDGSQAQSVQKIIGSGANIDINWSPNNQIVATYTETIDGERQRLFFVGQHNILNKSTIIEGRDLRTTWSPQGKRLLYSAYHSRDEYRPMLWIVDAAPDSIGQNRRSLSINTWADKCTFADEKTAYCAVSREPLSAYAAVNPALSFNQPDVLYKINVNTGAKTLIANPYGEFAIKQVIVSEDGKNLYFTDQIYRNVYKIRLK